MSKVKCDACLGKGQFYEACKTCSGDGCLRKAIKETILIPKGVFDGLTLRMAGKGNFSPRGPNGDLMLKVQVRPHEYFKRDGNDITTNKFISVT